jgi:hypothetical protein
VRTSSLTPFAIGQVAAPATEVTSKYANPHARSGGARIAWTDAARVLGSTGPTWTHAQPQGNNRNAETASELAPGDA